MLRNCMLFHFRAGSQPLSVIAQNVEIALAVAANHGRDFALLCAEPAPTVMPDTGSYSLGQGARHPAQHLFRFRMKYSWRHFQHNDHDDGYWQEDQVGKEVAVVASSEAIARAVIETRHAVYKPIDFTLSLVRFEPAPIIAVPMQE